MLESVKIQRRQSEIRQSLAELVGKDTPTEDETRSMGNLDAEYRTNETRYRAALTAEDGERREAGDELETRSERQWAELVDAFEVRQVALALDEGRALTGQTAEVVAELRAQGGYRGVPVPYAALEQRAGETVAADVPNPRRTLPIVDRLFPASVAARMGAQIISVGTGEAEVPVVTSSVTAGWQPNELGAVPGPIPFTTVDRPLRPDNTLGVTMKISRRALKQAGDALEQAVRRDMSGAIQTELDRAVFLGSGADGQPLGVITGAATYGIETTAAGAGGTWSDLRAAITRFMVANVASSTREVNMLARPELWDYLDGELVTGTATSQWDRLSANLPTVVLTSNALTAPAADLTDVLLTTKAGGVAPIYIGTWGAVDVIRDPFTEAPSGILRLTGLATMDVTVARPAQLQVVTDVAAASA